jgi:hypothetical protein
MTLTLEVGKWYSTESGCLIHIEKNENFCYYASVETSAGLNIYYRTVIQAFKGSRGWEYDSDGAANSLKNNK